MLHYFFRTLLLKQLYSKVFPLKVKTALYSVYYQSTPFYGTEVHFTGSYCHCCAFLLTFFKCKQKGKREINLNL